MGGTARSIPPDAACRQHRLRIFRGLSLFVLKVNWEKELFETVQDWLAPIWFKLLDNLQCALIRSYDCESPEFDPSLD